MKAHILAISGVVLVSASVVLMGQSRSTDERETRSTAPSYREHYNVLSERNMFVRDRRRPTTSAAASRPAPKPPEQTFMLTGVVYESLEDKAYAFFEDLTAGTILRVAVGEKVARGTIAGIDIDAVAYERDGKQTTVLVGEDLTGSRASIGSASSLPGASSSESASSGSPASAPAIDPNNPNLSVEERMRLRRQQETGRR